MVVICFNRKQRFKINRHNKKNRIERLLTLPAVGLLTKQKLITIKSCEQAAQFFAINFTGLHYNAGKSL